MACEYKALSLVLGVIICAQIVRSYSPLVLGKDDKCETLTYGLCRKMDYNRTIFPNFVGHRKQEKAAAVLNSLKPLMAVGCSPDTLTFACSVYFPMCTSLKEKIAPCRSLCLSVKNGCEGVMNRFGYSWPKELNCTKFPLLEKTNICVYRNKTGTNSHVTLPPLVVTPTQKRNNTKKGIGSSRPVQKYCPSGKVQQKSESSKQCCRCCQRGNRAARSGNAKCTLRRNFSKGKSFLKSLKGCRSRKSKRCYQECCNAKRREISRRKNRARNRNRKNRNRNRNKNRKIRPVG